MKYKNSEYFQLFGVTDTLLILHKVAEYTTRKCLFSFDDSSVPLSLLICSDFKYKFKSNTVLL